MLHPSLSQRSAVADPWQLLLSGSAIAVLVFELRRIILAGLSPAAIALVLTILAILALRFRAPAATLALTLAVTLFVAAIDGPLFTSWILAQITLFSLALQRPVRSVLIAAAIVAAILYESAFLIQSRSWNDPALIGLVTWTAAVAGIGLAIQSQREYYAAVEARALQAMQNRETEAQRRVVEERLRIARELHDAVAHHITVIGVYTGLARMKLAESAEAAEEPMARVQDATRAVLQELQDILRLLRDPERPDDDAVEAPLPGVDQLAPLVQSFRDIGVPIRFRTTGDPQPRSSEVDLAVYRVIQEAMTNAQKHGSGGIDVDLAFEPDQIRITVANRIADGPIRTSDRPPGSGFGLVGMRERVRAADGSLQVTTENAVHTLRVVLPRGVPPDHRPERDEA